MKMGFSEEEVEAVTKTARSAGAVGPKAKVPKLILDITYDDSDWILDYGSGRKAIHTEMLRDAGYGNAWAYDFMIDPEAYKLFLDDLGATKGKWDIIFASNVMNVQLTEEMLDRTLNEIWHLMNPYSIFITNYPKTPRKLPLTTEQLYSKLRAGFRRVCMTQQDIFVCSKPIVMRNGLKQAKTRERKSLARLAKLAFVGEE
jgi:hypothetical protein